MAVSPGPRYGHVIDQVHLAGLFMHGFLEIAIAHTHFLGHWAQAEHMGHPRLNAESVIAARVGRQGLQVARGNIAATEAVGVIGQDFKLGLVVDLPQVLEGHILAPPGEVVVVAQRLVRIGVELLLGQAAGHVCRGVVIVEIKGEVILIGGCPMGLEQHVIDIVVIVARPVAIALDPGIQQCGTDAVVRRAAEKGRLDVLPAAALGSLQGGADFALEGLGNGPGHKVDHPAHVLRPVAYRTGAAHHVDAVQVARGNRRHRQLWLTVRSECRGNTVNQYSGARRQARSQATHADVQGNIAAAGAVGFLHLHTRDALEGITDVHGALFDHRLAANHRAGAGVVLHHGIVGIAQPVTDHLDIHRPQLQRAGCGGTDRRCGTQGHGIATQLIAQATALQQAAQGLLGRQIAIDGRGLFACYQLRAEKNLQRSLLCQLAQGRAQGLGLNMDGARRRFASKGRRHRGADRQGQRQRQQACPSQAGRCAQRCFKRAKSPTRIVVFHVESCPVDRT